MSTGERQAEIVIAALELARSTSPAQITTHDIAAAIGVTQGAVFKHFATKEAIWLAAMKWVAGQLLAALDAAEQSAPSALAALDAVFHAHVAFVVAHPGVPRFIFHELQQPNDSAVKQEVRALLLAYRKLLLRQFGAAIRQRALPADLNQQAAATLFVGIVQGLVMQSMLDDRPASMKAQADHVFAIYLRGIREKRP
jgi:AcrR family transcriptional regulator